MTLWRRYDVRKFDADAILLREILCKKRDILMIKRRFQCGLCWNQVKYARMTTTHVCFIALTLAWSVGRCLNTRPNGLVFKHLPLDPANVNAWKNICNPYNIHYRYSEGQGDVLTSCSEFKYVLKKVFIWKQRMHRRTESVEWASFLDQTS